MSANHVRRRKAENAVITIIAGAAAALGLFMLVWILVAIASRGFSAINWQFFTQLPSPPGSTGGGLANAIVGTIMITGLATIIGVPIGMLAGAYLAEFGQEGRFPAVVRFFSNILIGAPSIIIGVFVYSLMVLRMGHFSGYAGAVALAIIMLPVVTRTTEGYAETGA